MDSLRKIWLLDEEGKPFEERIHNALVDLMPRFRRRFPFVRDEVEFVRSFEKAGRRITMRERARGRLEKLHGYAWSVLESIGLSLLRSGSMQLRVRRTEARTGPPIIDRLRSWQHTVEEVERGIQMREFADRLNPEERAVWDLKSRGYGSEEIARFRGSSVNSVDKVLSRIRQKLRLAAGINE